MKYDTPWIPWQVGTTLAEAGWVGMVTGFSIVLWSRLSIVVQDRRIRNGILGMILVNGFIWHTAMVTLQFGLAATPLKDPSRAVWLRLVNPFERTQISVFTVQEFIIFSFYILATYRVLNERTFNQTKRTRKAMFILLAVQTLEICMDIIIVTLDLAGYFTLKAIIHSWTYGIKLQLEFVVLNQLKETAKTGVPGLLPMPESDEEASRRPSGQSSPRKSVGEKQDWWINSRDVPQPLDTPQSSPKPTQADLHGAARLRPIPEDIILAKHPLSLDGLGVIPDTEG